MSGADLLRQTIQTLNAAGVEDAPRDARLLLARAMGVPADRLSLHLHAELHPGVEALLEPLVAARASRQPIAQILGERLFWGRSFVVSRAVLDPRPETETLVAAALSGPFLTVLDLGTGSGCIIVSLLADRPGALGWASDISRSALQIAATNAVRHGVAERLVLASGDWWQPVSRRFDLIVSNPPYIAEAEMDGLAPEVREWEPALALTPGGDGLGAYRQIAAGAGGHMTPGGRILLEIGPTQGEAVTGLLMAQGFTGVHILPDLDGRDRVVAAGAPVQGPPSATPFRDPVP